MTKSEVLEFLALKNWGPADQQRLIQVWNELRGDALGKIGLNHVRTPCRIKQIRSSLMQFANTEMK